MNSSHGNRVLITGGGAGIGAAIADRCRQDGLDPVTIDLRGGDIQADLSQPVEVRQAVATALEAGPIHRLVNNVGIVETSPFRSASLEQLQRSIALNVQTALLCGQLLEPVMAEAGFGRIVNITSRAALGKVDRTTYSIAKAGLIGMTRTMSLELGRSGITVNAVGPGPIRTAMFDQANPPGADSTRRIIEAIPMQRMGEPADVAHAVAFFLDERGGFITGQVTYVCGGMSVGAGAV